MGRQEVIDFVGLESSSGSKTGVIWWNGRMSLLRVLLIRAVPAWNELPEA
jgi:hypothetical protein